MLNKCEPLFYLQLDSYVISTLFGLLGPLNYNQFYKFQNYL